MITGRAPIALFVYDRPLHTRRTVEALAANHGADQSPLFVFSDGPRDESATAAVTQVRRFIRSVRGFRSVTLVERPTNLGLATSIIDGVSSICGRFARVVVVEDDLVTSPYFLNYVNDGLALYETDERVASIHAYAPPLRDLLPETFFLRGADCWGWATWSRSWERFEPDAAVLLARLRKSPNRHRFDYLGSYPNTRMLRNFMAGRNNSWAIRWHASALLADMLTLHPGRTLVRNIGLDGSGTHCRDFDDLNGALTDMPISLARIPVVPSDDVWRKYRRFHLALLGTKLLRSLRRGVKSGGADDGRT